MDVRLFLVVSSALFALSSAVSVLSTTAPDVLVDKDGVVVDKDGYAVVNDAGASGLYDGIDLSTLTEEQLIQLADAEDEILKGELDIYAYINEVAQKSNRPKRWIPLVARAAFTAGRALFRTFSRGRVTTSGSRLTRQYNKAGNYNDAVRDFRRLNPSGVKSFNNSKLQGMTGTLGKHRVTVRSSSSNGRPTLEVRSPKAGSETVRKFRYNRD